MPANARTRDLLSGVLEWFRATTRCARSSTRSFLCQGRTGCQWDCLPHDLPPGNATCYYFAKWRDDGTTQKIHDLLCRHVREKKGRSADPSLVVLDTQSVHAAAGVPATHDSTFGISQLTESPPRRPAR
ncbi:transposase [Nonomuraea sp. NPDC049269]|uniref:transposase n=1 Tax=Nonomuraea sp. NPDC049269 TaxID=3364349 RepID=UPI003710F4EF